MNNDELKKKIVKELNKLQDYGYMIRVTYNESTGTGSGTSHQVTNDYIADALIAAGIGDVKDLQVQVDSLEITNIALQAGYDDAEKDRLYWVDKYKEAEHRAEKAERALKDCIDYYSYSGLCPVLDCNYNKACWQKKCTSDIAKCFKIQAEKELAEEKR